MKKNKIFFVQNPEGKVFKDSVSTEEQWCKREFCASWFSSWNIFPDSYQTDVIWKMFEKRGFKLIEIEVELPVK